MGDTGLDPPRVPKRAAFPSSKSPASIAARTLGLAKAVKEIGERAIGNSPHGSSRAGRNGLGVRGNDFGRLVHGVLNQLEKMRCRKVLEFSLRGSMGTGLDDWSGGCGGRSITFTLCPAS
jgi:hypothetical protein